MYLGGSSAKAISGKPAWKYPRVALVWPEATLSIAARPRAKLSPLFCRCKVNNLCGVREASYHSGSHAAFSPAHQQLACWEHQASKQQVCLSLYLGDSKSLFPEQTPFRVVICYQVSGGRSSLENNARSPVTARQGHQGSSLPSLRERETSAWGGVKLVILNLCYVMWIKGVPFSLVMGDDDTRQTLQPR